MFPPNLPLEKPFSHPKRPLKYYTDCSASPEKVIERGFSSSPRMDPVWHMLKQIHEKLKNLKPDYQKLFLEMLVGKEADEVHHTAFPVTDTNPATLGLRVCMSRPELQENCRRQETGCLGQTNGSNKWHTKKNTSTWEGYSPVSGVLVLKAGGTGVENTASRSRTQTPQRAGGNPEVGEVIGQMEHWYRSGE